jgi:D-alanine-D-alanine ligase-like ATP-grasp enzyme
MATEQPTTIGRRSSPLRRWSLQFWRLGYYLKFVWDKLANKWGTLDDPMRTNFYLKLWREAAEKLSVKFALLPDGFCEASVNGRVTRMYQNLVMLDYPVTIKLARSKPLVLRLLAEHGIKVPEYTEFTLGEIDGAIDFLRSMNGPIVVKPGRGTAGGDGVTTNVRTPRELKRAAIFASLYTHSLLAERQIPGVSYRLLYLNGRLLDAIRRKSPSVVGDGSSTILQLLHAENARRASMAGTEGLTWLRADADCRNTLSSAGLSLDSVPANGAEVVVKQAANDNSSRDNESVTPLLCRELIDEGARAAAILGVQLAGVDVITTDPGKPLRATDGVINEVNTTPGLHYHYQISNAAEGVPVIEPILKHLLALNEQH